MRIDVTGGTAGNTPAMANLGPQLRKITHVHPTGIVTSHSTGDVIGSCLISAKNLGKGRSPCPLDSGTRGIVVGKEYVAGIVSRIPSLPNDFI